MASWAIKRQFQANKRAASAALFYIFTFADMLAGIVYLPA
jgi:hypothetical protein